MDAQNFRWKTVVSFTLLTMFLTPKTVPAYLNVLHGAATKTGMISPPIDLDLTDNLLILASNFALCGYMLSMDGLDHNKEIRSAYASIWSILTALSILVKLAGITLPFPTSLVNPYCWILVVVVTIIYTPVFVRPCLWVRTTSSEGESSDQNTDNVATRANIGNPGTPVLASTGNDDAAGTGGAGPEAV